MKCALIYLRGGLVAAIDEQDIERVQKQKWRALPKQGGEGFYAVSHQFGAGGQNRHLYLHRFILNAKPGQIVDHINGDGLDNRRDNLRFATPSQNVVNRAHNNSNGYKGVVSNGSGKFYAETYKNNKKFRGGLFHTREEAARDYDRLAREHHGEFAWLNFPEEVS